MSRRGGKRWKSERKPFPDMAHFKSADWRCRVYFTAATDERPAFRVWSEAVALFVSAEAVHFNGSSKYHFATVPLLWHSSDPFIWKTSDTATPWSHYFSADFPNVASA